MSIITKAAEFIEKGEVKLIGKSEHAISVQVKDKIVIFKKKPGRTLDSCSCENHSRFVNENARCSHKLAAATYIVMRRIK